jgi:hypothetical protein
VLLFSQLNGIAHFIVIEPLLMRKPTKTPGKLKAFLKSLGPGLITGASDDNPSGIATYSQVGAQFGFSMLWTALISATYKNEIYGPISRVTSPMSNVDCAAEIVLLVFKLCFT